MRVEGVEAWLVADFFKTQISRTSFDDFYGRPVLVFRSTPESSWPGVVKQVMDFVGALRAADCCSPFLFVLIALLIKLTSPGPGACSASSGPGSTAGPLPSTSSAPW